jgi:2-oxoglutarate dehydrogenase E1 component
VAQPSTPASYFHLLRLQTLRPDHKPLIVFTPKSMLRNKKAVSAPEDFTGHTSFRPVIADAESDPTRVETVLLCSGKVVWDLRAERAKRSDELTAIVPVEQLYPLPVDQIVAELGRFPRLRDVRWVQDEPRNMGAWPFMWLNLAPRLGQVEGASLVLTGVTRPGSSAPSVGSHARHLQQHRELLDEAFA